MSRAERQFPRFALEAEVTITGDGVRTRGRTSNVSRGGMCAVTDDALPRGVVVEVSLELVFPDDSFSEPLKLPARVVWSTPVDDHHQVGMSFRALPAEKLRYLDMFLRFLEDGAESVRTDKPRKTSRFDV